MNHPFCHYTKHSVAAKKRGHYSKEIESMNLTIKNGEWEIRLNIHDMLDDIFKLMLNVSPAIMVCA